MKPTDELNSGSRNEKRSTRPSWFEWLQLSSTLSVPIAMGIFSILQNQAQVDQHRVDLEIAEAARQNQLVIEERNRREEEYLADDQHRETIHRDYEGFLVSLLLKEGMCLNVSSAARHIARFRTVSALSQVDPSRRTFLIRSLFEVGLIQLTETENWTRAIIDLRFANLSGIRLGIADRELYHNLLFESTVLRNSSFTGLDISGLNFVEANRKYADLRRSSSEPNLPVWFNTSNLVGASFADVKKLTASFDNANLTMGILNSFQCYRCSFIETIADDANFDDARFQSVNGQGSVFYSAYLNRASFVHSLLDQVEFYHTELHHINLSYSKSIYIKKKVCLFVCLSVLYAFSLCNSYRHQTFQEPSLGLEEGRGLLFSRKL